MNSKDLQIDWLRAFLAVIDTGSMTAAAKQVARSQSAVSMQIKKLEDSVGRPLLSRGTGSISLTPTGYDLLSHARQLMAVHAGALAAIHGQSLDGRITMGVPDDYAMAYLAPVLRTFAARFIDVEITLVCEPSTVLVGKVERGDIDLAIVSRDNPNRGELLFREDLIWIGSEQHEAWKKSPLPIAVHGLNSQLRGAVLAGLLAQQRPYRVAFNSPNVLGQLAIVSAGVAVAVVTRCSLLPGLKMLDARHGLPALPTLDVAVMRSEKSRRSRAVDAMYAHITQVLGKGEAGTRPIDAHVR